MREDLGYNTEIPGKERIFMNENEKNTNGMNEENFADAAQNIANQNTQNRQDAASDNYNYSWNGGNFVAKKRRNGKRVAALMVACTLVIAALAFCAGAITSRTFGGKDPTPEVSTPALIGDNSTGDEEQSETEHSKAPQVITSSATAKNDYDSLSKLYEKCSASCATIYVKASNGYAIGSGFVVSKEGYIITNCHVVSGGTEITVIFYNGDKYTAKVIGADSLSDIAVLKIEADDLTPIEIGDSSTLKIGDAVVAIGTPYSMSLAGTMTTGVISGVNRKVDLTNSYGTKTKTMTLIQTDSSINPGNSGGPLINMAGQVIGINSLKLSNYEGIGFAIPISSALNIINELIEYGEVRDYDSEFVTATPKLNITVQSVSNARTQYGLPESAPEGCFVVAVSRSSAIYKAGLDLYDIITEFNGTTIENNDQLTEALAKCGAGQKVTCKVYRMNRDGSGKTVEITFVLEAAS